jgi:hypothetical protein
MGSSKRHQLPLKERYSNVKKNYHFVVICKMQTLLGMLSQEVSKTHVVIFCYSFHLWLNES